MGVGWTWWVLLPDLLCRASLEGSFSTLPPHPSLRLHTISLGYRWRYKSALPEKRLFIACPVQVLHMLFIFPKTLRFLLSKSKCSSPMPLIDNLFSCFGGRGSFCRESPLLLSGLLITNRESLVCGVSLCPAPWTGGGSQELGDLKCNFLYLFHFLLGVVESNKQGGWQGPA